MSLKFKFVAKAEQWIDRFVEIDTAHDKAGTATMDEIGKRIKTKGRANIASAGFGKRWQNALRVDRYPKRGVSSNAALWIHHNIPYADVFEFGATIHGKPLLWIPLSNVPKKIGGKRMTPQEFSQSVGPLQAINPPGRPPMLVAKYSSRNRAKISLAGLRRGAGAAGGGQSVPVFVGVPLVRIRKRFNLRSVFRAAAAQISSVWDDKFKVK